MVRLSDKHIAAIRAAAEDNEQSFGFGDVLLLCDELQTRRANCEGADLDTHVERVREHLQDGKYMTCTQRNNLLRYPYIEDGTEPLQDRLPDVLPDEITNPSVIEGLIKRIEKGEGILDKYILGLFHAFQKQGYFQTITFVDRDALKQVLNALNGGGHLIRELQATRNLPRAEGEKANAIDQLIQDIQEPKYAAD